MEETQNLVVSIGIIFVIFSLFGISLKLIKMPKMKIYNPRKNWGSPGNSLYIWCLKNPRTKNVLFWIGQTSAWLFQVALWLLENFLRAIWAVFNGITKTTKKVVKK